MAERSWFFASNGQQQGPYGEAQFRGFMAQGAVTPDTLVWTDGMANWQRAADVPGLMTGAGPYAMPQAGPPPVMAGGGYGGRSAGGSGAVSAELPVWGLLGRTVIYVIGVLLIIPAPWVATSFYRWFAFRIRVPGRGGLAFTGQPGDIWWVFVSIGLLSYVGAYDNTYEIVSAVVQAVLGWMILRWIVGNLASDGQKLPMVFKGSVWGYIGWQLLMMISLITIIGWAWVVTAWTRWICRNISGTRREIVFNASGLGVLGRSLLMVIGCVFIIPIPWVLRWYSQWFVAQFALVERV